MDEQVNTQKPVEATPVTPAATVSTAPTTPVQPTNPADTYAIISIVLTALDLCSWLIPFVGCLVPIAAVVLGFMGLKSEKYKILAIISLVISGAVFLFSLVSAVILGIGMLQGATNLPLTTPLPTL